MNADIQTRRIEVVRPVLVGEKRRPGRRLELERDGLAAVLWVPGLITLSVEGHALAQALYNLGFAAIDDATGGYDGLTRR